MNNEQYTELALTTLSDGFHPELVHPDILHAAIGLSTESGEILDAVKKSLFYGKPLDLVNIIEEGGDLMWYLAILFNRLEVTFGDVQIINIDKLKKRFPDGFKKHEALFRDLEAERKVLEGN